MTQRAKLRRLAFIQRVPCVRPACRRPGGRKVDDDCRSWPIHVHPGTQFRSRTGRLPREPARFCPILPTFRRACGGHMGAWLSGSSASLPTAAGPVRRSFWSPVSGDERAGQGAAKRASSSIAHAPQRSTLLVEALRACRVRPGPRRPTRRWHGRATACATSRGRSENALACRIVNRTVVRPRACATTPRGGMRHRDSNSVSSTRCTPPANSASRAARQSLARQHRHQLAQPRTREARIAVGSDRRRSGSWRPSASRSAATSERSSSGRDSDAHAFLDRHSRSDSMPASPLTPLPRAMRNSTVSA